MTPRRLFSTISACAMVLTLASPAHAGLKGAPDWVKPAARYLDDQGFWDKAEFDANEPMTRSAFKRVIKAAFGGGYSRTRGYLKAGELSATLVKLLGTNDVAEGLDAARSPDGWDPEVGKWFGTEVVAREMGLRFNRPTTEEAYEAGADQRITQADVAWSIWKAKTGASTWGAAALTDFELADYTAKQRKVVKYALSLVGTPYVWGGESLTATGAGYPYGAQPAGGADCSGFTWLVLRESAPGWDPPGRNYGGWSFPERSSKDMAKAAPIKLGYKKLLPGDVVFFSPDGRDAKARTVYHAGIYLGHGWMVHSSGSRDGVSISEMGRGSWWWDQFTWGRRVIQ